MIWWSMNIKRNDLVINEYKERCSGDQRNIEKTVNDTLKKKWAHDHMMHGDNRSWYSADLYAHDKERSDVLGIWL